MGAFLAWPPQLPVHSSQRKFIILFSYHVVGNWDGPDAKAFSAIYKSNWVCSAACDAGQGRAMNDGEIWTNMFVFV